MTTETNSTLPTDSQSESSPPVRYFYRMEPLRQGGHQVARVAIGKRLVTIEEGDLTVEEATELRNWLNSVLPL